MNKFNQTPSQKIIQNELEFQAAMAILSQPSESEMAQCAEAAKELLLRQSEQGKDWGTAIYVLLTYIQGGELPH